MIPAVYVAIALLVMPFVGLWRSLCLTVEGPRLRGQLIMHAADSVYGVDEVLPYDHQHNRTEELDELGCRMCDAAMSPLVLKGLRCGMNLVLTLVSAASIIWAGVSARLDPLPAAALAAASLWLFKGSRGMGDAVGYLGRSLSAARWLWEPYHTSEAVSDGLRGLHLDTPLNIEWRDVGYRYPGVISGNLALPRVSVTVVAGGWTVLIGANGSGKSTTAQLLFRYDELTGDDILIDGISVCEYTLDSLRRAVALMPQRGQVLDATIVENP